MSERQVVEAERLIARFFDGDTTLAEEQSLYRLFSAEELPPSLERYRKVFAAFGSMQAVPAKKRLMPRRPTMWKAVAGVAAAVVLAFGITAYSDMRERQMLALHYAGSYVIENGQRIDDLTKIRPDIENALKKADKIEASVEARRDWAEQTEQDVLDNIDDPEARQRVKEMLGE